MRALPKRLVLQDRPDGPLLPAGPAAERVEDFIRGLEREGFSSAGARDELGRAPVDFARLWEPYGGKMFGILLGRDPHGGEVELRAFSGQLHGAWTLPGWCPPLFDVSRWRALESRVEPEVKRAIAAHEAATGKKDEPEPEPEKPKAAEASKPKAVEASKPAATKEDKPAAKKEDKKATGAEDDALTSAMNDWIAALPEKAREKLVGDLSKCETEEEEWKVLVASAKADTTKVREKQREVLIAEAAKKGFK